MFLIDNDIPPILTSCRMYRKLMRDNMPIAICVGTKKADKI